MQFWISGVPAPQGSKRALHHRTTGNIVMIESCKRLKPWRQAVAAAARSAIDADVPPLEGPVRLDVTFYFARPKAHYCTGRNSAVLRESAPRFPSSLGRLDLSKLVRALEDALTGIVYLDDAQIVTIGARKAWCETTLGQGALVEVFEA